MPSPFPGMDPYLEAPGRWPDVHQSLITYIRDALQPHLRPRYFARMGERVYVLEPPEGFYPDITIIGRPPGLTQGETGQPGLRERAVAYAEAPATEAAEVAGPEADTPFLVTMPPAEHREPFIEVIHASGEEVVTVIEVLSPANKTPGLGYQLYRRKQRQLLDSPVHLIEVDLLSAGLPTVALAEESRAGLPPHRYLVSVRRGPDSHRFEAYPVPLDSRLPRIRVPLRPPDPDIVLDMQAVLGQSYERGSYADLIDYRQPAPVSLSAEESAWVDGLLRGRGLRS